VSLTRTSGHRAFLCSRDQERGEAALSSLQLSESQAHYCHLILLDTTSMESCAAAAASVAAVLGDAGKLDAVVNNAGIGLQTADGSIIDTNLHGVKRVVEAFLSLLRPDGRIVNVGSGSGPSFVKSLGQTDDARAFLRCPNSWADIEKLVEKHRGGPADSMGGYGLSKAALTLYTMLLARDHPSLMVGIASPGFIATKMTAGYGATKEPQEGTVSLLYLLFAAGKEASGCYFGSDAVRSPLHFMRNPGEPAYDGTMPF